MKPLNIKERVRTYKNIWIKKGENKKWAGERAKGKSEASTGIHRVWVYRDEDVSMGTVISLVIVIGKIKFCKR